MVQTQAELTVQEAADLLNVTPPYVVALLEAGRLAYRIAGGHRRVRFADLLAFKRKDDTYRSGVADELTRDAVDLRLGYED